MYSNLVCSLVATSWQAAYGLTLASSLNASTSRTISACAGVGPAAGSGAMRAVYTCVKSRATIRPMKSDAELYTTEIRRLRAELDKFRDRCQTLEIAIGDALSALGFPRHPEAAEWLYEAETYAAREMLLQTGVKPAGFENYPQDVQEMWEELLERYRPE